MVPSRYVAVHDLLLMLLLLHEGSCSRCIWMQSSAADKDDSIFAVEDEVVLASPDCVLWMLFMDTAVRNIRLALLSRYFNSGATGYGWQSLVGGSLLGVSVGV